jgi:hypothetical protein
VRRTRVSVRKRSEEDEGKWWRRRVIVNVLVRVMFFKPSGLRLDACVGTRHDGLDGVGGWYTTFPNDGRGRLDLCSLGETCRFPTALPCSSFLGIG